MSRWLLWAAVALCLAAPAPAHADVFNGRIAFSSLRPAIVAPAPPRSAPPGRSFDIFGMNPDGTGLRQLTTNPAGKPDRQPACSPGATAIAYTIDKPNSPINHEIARMTACGQVTASPPRPLYQRSGR